MSNKSRENAGKSHQSVSGVKYELEPDGRYRIDNFDKTPAFSSFLPGIGGMDGVPLWCMYVNRAQAVVSFGVDNKDNAIAEFLPATWAYQLVGVQGFRTFCKVDGTYYEPFQNDLASNSYKHSRSMWIEPDRLKIREINETLGLTFDIEYFSPVNQPIGSLVRLLTITNSSDKSKSINALDGLALIIPAGFTDFGLKAMRRISEAYASVRLVCDKIPFYSTKVSTHDEAEVEKIEKGSFYASWIVENDRMVAIEPFVDPDVIFGSGNDLITPRLFIANDEIDRAAQVWENRFTCALTPVEAVLEPGQSLKLVSIAGFSPTEKMLADFLPNFKTLQDFENASVQSKKLIDEVTLPAFTVSEETRFDAYSKQNYLDNILRGGVPLSFPSKSGPALLHMYSRRHGDLERDYNYFVLPPHPLSSGPGNYRDICQNRRNDVWFYPEVLDREVRMFVELIQADGYNPLSVEGYRWLLNKKIDPLKFCPAEGDNARNDFCNILKNSFYPGQLLGWADLYGIKIKDRFEWLSDILRNCDTRLVAHGHEGGYWVDHWTYIIDLLEAFDAVYPDKIGEVLIGEADIKWFNKGACVVPRSEKYVMRHSGPLQIDSVIDGQPSATPLPPVTVFGKLCALLAIKAVSFDYDGKAIEMEAGRPGWNDALNGLPGLFGSSTCEVAEIARLARWLLNHLPKKLPEMAFPAEAAEFINNVKPNIEKTKYVWGEEKIKLENYRKHIAEGILGNQEHLTGKELKDMLEAIEKRALQAIKKSKIGKSELVHTYYINTPVLSENQEAPNLVEKIEKFESQPLPLYLEGQVHRLRVLGNTSDARKVYKNVRNSPLFDTSLQMYKINECLSECPLEIGRARTFTRGWFENESIWTHMSYKYLLELLKAGLNEEFFEDAKTMLVPFMNPEVYGRSILENSSFLASSVNPDPATRGRGFVARFSGSTAEFIHMWLLMTAGKQPFFVKKDKLHFALKPVLPGEWFTKNDKTINWKVHDINIPANSFACAFLGNILLIYHNQSRKNTFGKTAVKPVRYVLDEDKKIDAEYLGQELAEKIRARKVGRIDVWLE